MQAKITYAFGVAALLATTPLVAAEPRGDEPVAVPRAIKQGIDFVYVDPQMSTVARRKQRPQNWLSRIFNPASARRNAPNPVFFDLARGLQQYQATWGRLPQVSIPSGAALKPGATGNRVRLLRTRLGLTPIGSYDAGVSQAVATFQRVHGLGNPDGVAGKATIAALNRGSSYYARRIAINMERAYRLPTTGTFNRYVVVDSGAAQLTLFDRDRPVDGMRAVVGSTKTKTPMMAVLMRNAKANPYWHVPPELIRSLTAKKVKEQGLTYFRDFHYEVLSDWGPNPQPVDPKTINWRAVATKGTNVMVRQKPGPWNSMGAMKFEMPNDFGIYLHDSPHKELFAADERHLSNGCVRLEDYQRFASWVFGAPPPVTGQPEQVLPLPRAVPIYMTYLTVQADANGVVFRPDPYGFDALAMPQMFGPASIAANDAGEPRRG
ncbi:L,D-transpeptidase family protein [Sphingomonas sp. BN140010]|uniref:L,D-transpeptidase family protein n=1 Tax=Sphingomonas arvum TaxID=2992113 RepID=A0ABT3JD25_9SPHN|nr:L,D-transpeptidase family protein [Sphingomonas sp. BN140010]MCW3796962.1 L,D-transpeptidase family protein [Sphingomonas sp. BN140010]